MKWMVAADQGTWEEKEIICSVLEVEDEETALHHQYISYILGEAAVRVHAVDRCLVVLDEIRCDFIGWYADIYESYKDNINRKQDWWNHIENDLKRLFGGLIKSISKLHQNHFHGNLTKGIAVSNGQAKLFNMKPCGIKGYEKDIDDLLYMITNIVNRVPPDLFFEGLADGFTKEKARLYCSKEFSIFLESSKERKVDDTVDIYHPFFWPVYQQMYFLERVYDLFWKDFKLEENTVHWHVILVLENSFSCQWNWVEDIPNEGAFSKVYNDERNPRWQRRDFPKAVAIAFWRHCKTHYNDKLAVGENRKTVNEIRIELNKRFNILGRVFQAVCKFTRKFDHGQVSVICDTLAELRNMVAM
ncbi:hypothetical protein QN277_026961 [Acacia crassicarpa]|uniref:Uncharacterized protein n=1 Tax=Acacia crassicarpa TaxID=499986 RepID=A0AAE1JAE8_9FABA|nr:hypothetical protein QN277_026961 [Acacia crassicarpa]